MKLATVAALALLALAALAPSSQAQVSGAARRDSLWIDLPLVEAPYNLAHGGRAPSMAQSLAVTTAFTELVHGGIQRAWGPRHRQLAGLTIWATEIFAGTLPLGEGWLHEEFHRAVLGNRGIGSFDDVYRLDLGAETIAVSHVRDEDLVRLKNEHPAEQVRLGAAGIEGELLLARSLERARFFGGSTTYHLPTLWLAKVGAASYVASSVWRETDELTDEMNAADGARIDVRDFTGVDFSAWAYDLFRPDEPYAARGVHPSGVGIDRYVRASDLAPAERAYLRRQGALQLLNFLDPALVGVHEFTVRGAGGAPPLRLQLSAAHFLTSFGHTVDANLMARRGDAKLALSLHRYVYAGGALPGVEAELLDRPLTVASHRLALSPRAALWVQPADQRFHATGTRPGGLLALRVRAGGGPHLRTFVEIEGKTEGWVAGNVHLAPNVSARAGISARIW